MIVGNDPGDGHVGMASNGEPVPVFGIPCGAPVAAGPIALFGRLGPSGVACHCVEFGTFFLISTHDEAIAARSDRVVRILDGRVVSNVQGGA